MAEVAEEEDMEVAVVDGVEVVEEEEDVVLGVFEPHLLQE